MTRFKNFIFSVGVLAVIGGMFPLRAEAAPIELQLSDFQLSAPLIYEASGQIRADLTGDVFTFSSAAYPDAPASDVMLTPPLPGSIRPLATVVHPLYNSRQVCWPTGLTTEACGGTVAESVSITYHIDRTYRLSLDGEVNTADQTATLTPIPEKADLDLLTVVDSRVRVTGDLANAPDFIKNPLLAAANLAASQFGDGNIETGSGITAFEPTNITADAVKTANVGQLDIYWSDLMIHYASPSVTFGGTLALDSVNTVFGLYSGKDAFFSSMVSTALGADGSCGQAVSNCIGFSGIDSASFTYALPNVPPVSTAVPEPATAALLALGLAGTAFARRLRRAAQA